MDPLPYLSGLQLSFCATAKKPELVTRLLSTSHVLSLHLCPSAPSSWPTPVCSLGFSVRDTSSQKPSDSPKPLFGSHSAWTSVEKALAPFPPYLDRELLEGRGPVFVFLACAGA